MDNDRFDCIYRAYANIVLKAAMHFCGNYHVAEEIMQSTFLKLYLEMEHMNLDNARPWLLTVAKNEALNTRRKRSRELVEEDIELLQILCESTPSSEHMVIAKENKEEIVEFCNCIFQKLYEENTRWCEAITLVYCLEVPQKNVAKKLGMSIDSLQSMLYRARKWIQKKFGKQYYEFFH